MQWVKMAWNSDAHIQMPSFASTDRAQKLKIGTPSKGEIDYDFGNHPNGAAAPGAQRAGGEPDNIRAEIRRIILEELKELTAR
jgi:hypothetical protein